MKHRVLAGDDGNGGSFEIDILPVVDKWWQNYRRLCGKGVITYVPRIGPASNWISKTVEKHEITTPEQDAAIAAGAKNLDKKEITYCLGVQDCRSIEDCVLSGPVSQRINDQAQLLWEVILEQVKSRQ